MVCSFGSGKMAALSRLLEAGNSLYQISEDVNHHKLIAQYISKELAEADEENLLDVEDMYVFGWKPMVDTLHLVCCNTCKKPIKASQFAVHADLCKVLSLKDESFVEVDGTKPKKPPKKERKNFARSPAIVNTATGTLNRSETVEMRSPASESHLDDQFRMASSPNIEEKRVSSVDTTQRLSSLGVRGYKVHSPGVVPPAKRPKMITPDQLPLSDDPETVLDNRNSGSHDAGKELRDGMLTANDMRYSLEHQMSRQVNGCCMPAKDAPAPIASKIYYSQRNLRLRSAFRIMYNESLMGNNISSSNGLQEHVKSPHITSSTCLADEHVNVQPDMKLPDQLLPSGDMPDQNTARSSEACLNKKDEFLPAGFSSQDVHTNHRSRPRTASGRISRNQYLSQPHSFASNSGTIQQPNGSVPVI